MINQILHLFCIYFTSIIALPDIYYLSHETIAVILSLESFNAVSQFFVLILSLEFSREFGDREPSGNC